MYDDFPDDGPSPDHPRLSDLEHVESLHRLLGLVRGLVDNANALESEILRELRIAHQPVKS